MESPGVAYFTPRQKGEYVVSVMRQETHIPNSPFRIAVGDKELGHAAGCTVKGAITEATANQPNEIKIDTTNGGNGSLYQACWFGGGGRGGVSHC